MVSEFQDTALGMQAQVDEFVEQYAESTKRVIDRECSDVKKHERDLVENAKALAWHEESGTTELRWELQQARIQVSRGSGLAEQQQRRLESSPVEPEYLGTLRTKATSDPFRVSFLVFGFSCDHWTHCGFLCVSTKSFLWLLRKIVAENAKEECEIGFGATGFKVLMVSYLNESCMSPSGMSSGPHGQTSATAHEFNSTNMSNEVYYKSCSLHKSVYIALQRDNFVCVGSHSGSPVLCNVTCPGNSSQFCGGDSWYTFQLTSLWVAPVEVIRSGMPEPVENNVPTSTTICLDFFNEIVPCISTCINRPHFASYEPVWDPLWRMRVVRQRCFGIEHAGVSRVAHAKVQSLCQKWTVHGWCDIKHVEGYTIASNTLKCKAVDVKIAVEIWAGNVSCVPKLCGVPPSIANTLHTSVERYYLDFVAYNCKSGYSLNGLRYSKKEFFLRCKSDGTYVFLHLTSQPINCILEDALTAKRIDLSGGSLPSSSPAILGSNECMKYQHGGGHTLSGIPDSSDLFTMTCLDGDYTMIHCNPVQCGVPPVIAHATPLGGCFVTIIYVKQVQYQHEAGYHVESGHKSGSKPEGCHATERTESEQPVQATEELVGAVSSCGHDASLEERFASWIGQQDRPFPSHEWLEDWSLARCDEMSQMTVLVTGPLGRGKTAGVRLLARHVRRTFLECDMREVEERQFAELILKGQGGLRLTSVAILNIDTDVTDRLKWMLCKAAQQLQIPLIFVSNDGVVNARDELVQKCLRLEVPHDPQNAEQALRRMTQRNVSEVLEMLEQDGEELCRALQCLYLTSCGKSFETLERCAFAAKAMALGEVAECTASHAVRAEGTSDSTTNEFCLGAVSTLRKQRCHHSAQECPMESPQIFGSLQL